MAIEKPDTATQPTIASRLVGIHAATVCPLTDEYGVDADSLQAHVAEVTAESRIAGLLINGHAGENGQLSRESKKQVTALVRAAVGPACFLTCGINSESAIEAAEHARDAQTAGADALLVFPPNGWALGQNKNAVVEHHTRIAEATDLPLLLYQAPVGAGRMAYPPSTLARLAALAQVAGVKEGSWEVATYEENWRMLQKLRPELSVMASGDEHLLTCYMIGTTGSQVSLAAIVPGAVCDLWDAASAGDWVRARDVHDRLYPLAVAIYRRQTGAAATARLKACLHILGHIPIATVYPPTQAATPADYIELEAALRFLA